MSFHPLCALALVVPLVVSLAGAAHAGETALPDPQDVVPGTEGATYLDLVRQVLPDLEESEGVYRGSKVVDTRHIAGPPMGGDPPGEYLVFDVAALPLRAAGRDRLAILFDLGETVDTAEGFAVLALYELGSSPLLLDAVQVGFDRRTWFRDPASVALNADDELVLTISMHANASQTYVTTAMIMARGERLQLVDTVFTFDDRGCGFERTQVPQFRSGAREGRRYADVVVTVVEITRRAPESCAGDLPQAGSRVIEVTYRWDDRQARFLPDSDALDRLERENEQRF